VNSVDYPNFFICEALACLVFPERPEAVALSGRSPHGLSRSGSSHGVDDDMKLKYACLGNLAG